MKKTNNIFAILVTIIVIIAMLVMYSNTQDQDFIVVTVIFSIIAIYLAITHNKEMIDH